MRVEQIGEATLYCGDCLEILPTLGKVDAVVTDPPYNVGMKYDGYKDMLPPDQYRLWLTCILTGARAPTIVYFPGVLNDAAGPVIPFGYRLIRRLGWHRKEFAGDLWFGGPAISWEPILWLYYGEKPFYRKLFGEYGRDFIVIPDVKNEKSTIDHPCPKPIKVMRWLMNLFVKKSVVDPCMGSGTSGVAAISLGLTYYGIEQSPKYFDIACKRIEREYQQLKLFKPGDIKQPEQGVLLDGNT